MPIFAKERTGPRNALTGSYVYRTSSSNADFHSGNMTYATASPAATTGGQGTNPVSEKDQSIPILFCSHLEGNPSKMVLLSVAIRPVIGGAIRVLAANTRILIAPKPTNLSRSYRPSHIFAPPQVHYQPYRLPIVYLLISSFCPFSCNHYGDHFF